LPGHPRPTDTDRGDRVTSDRRGQSTHQRPAQAVGTAFRVSRETRPVWGISDS